MRKMNKNKILKIFIKIFLSILLCHIIINNFFVVNLTPSIKTGIYFVLPVNKDELKIGDIVLFSMPDEIDKFVHEREYITNNCHTFLKEIGALEKDRIKIENEKLYINDKFIGKIEKKDTLGRELPQITSFTVPKDYFFPIGTHQKSFDGRYYGKIDIKLIEKKAFLIVDFKKLFLFNN